MALPFDSDLDALFDLNEFAVSVTLNGTAALAIPIHETDVELDTVAGVRLFLYVKTSDVTATSTVTGSPVVYAASNYTAKLIQDEGYGLSTIALEAVP